MSGLCGAGSRAGPAPRQTFVGYKGPSWNNRQNLNEVWRLDETTEYVNLLISKVELVVEGVSMLSGNTSGIFRC